MSIQATIKAIQNIMRKDESVTGDGQRIEQLVWLLFLKIFDDQERQYELIDPKYKSPLPENLRWRNWATNAEGTTGDELLEFIEDLIKKLKNLPANSANPRTFIVREVFRDIHNYMRSGTLIRQVINKINEIDFNKKEDRHLLNDIYEQILRELQSAGNYGEFYTPRPITHFVVEMVNPKLGEKILDPACGTGGFLVSALDHIRQSGEVKTAKDEQKLQNSVNGTELKPLAYLLAITNMILHGIEEPTNIKRGDSLSRPLRDIGPGERVDIIVANPPFGGQVKDGTEANFPQNFRTKATADLFLILFIHLLKSGGRAGIVLPDGSLFGDGVTAKIKEKLLEECNLHTIVRLPPGVFSPYAGVNTNLLFFEKGKPTKEIWYYQMPLPEGMKQYTKGRPITDAEFAVVRQGLGESDAEKLKNPNMWPVSIDQIRARGYNLDFKNPKSVGDLEHRDSEDLVRKILEKESQIEKILKSI